MPALFSRDKTLKLALFTTSFPLYSFPSHFPQLSCFLGTSQGCIACFGHVEKNHTPRHLPHLDARQQYRLRECRACFAVYCKDSSAAVIMLLLSVGQMLQRVRPDLYVASSRKAAVAAHRDAAADRGDVPRPRSRASFVPATTPTPTTTTTTPTPAPFSAYPLAEGVIDESASANSSLSAMWRA